MLEIVGRDILPVIAAERITRRTPVSLVVLQNLDEADTERMDWKPGLGSLDFGLRVGISQMVKVKLSKIQYSSNIKKIANLPHQPCLFGIKCRLKGGIMVELGGGGDKQIRS